MKKWIILLLVIILIICAGYIFLPKTLVFHQGITALANPPASTRVILDDNSFPKWWPGEVRNSKDGKQLLYNGYQFQLKEKRFSALIFSVSKDDFSATALLNFIPINQDSLDLSWDAEITSKSFTNRISNLVKTGSFKNELGAILDKMKIFFSNPTNLYDFKIDEVRVTDSTLISIADESKGYPSTDFIYQLIDELTDYSKKNDAQATGNPMLNVRTEDSINYTVKVALPVNKKLPDSGNIKYKWMLPEGNIFVTEVQGGPRTIAKAINEIDTYMHDFKRTGVAIPFQSLVTDRRKEPDSSKWITKVYYPVM